jgi:predicted nucleic acid-binding protein
VANKVVFLSIDPGPVTLVDTCVLLDVLTDDPRWADWSAQALAAARDVGEVAINPIVYAELSAGFDTIEDLDAALPERDVTRYALPYEAGFLASRAYLRYRRRGGARRSPLPDFYIGAHAAVTGFRLLTRDASRYRDYFPKVELLAPAGGAPVSGVVST